MADFSKAIELNPDFALAYLDRGVAYLIEFKDCNGALPDLNRAIELNPNLGKAYLARAFCYNMLGDNARAQADFAKAKILG